MPKLTRLTLFIALLLAATIGALAQSSPGSPTTGGSISGRITVGDKTLAGLVVGAQRSDLTPPDSEPAAKATTSEDGSYRLVGLAPGRYRVLPLSSVYIMPGGNERGSLQGKTVMLGENEQIDRIDFALTRGAVITGKVVDGSGRPFVGNYVILMSVDDQGRKRRIQEYDPTMYEIDDRGVYRIFGLLAGRYVVSAGHATDGTSIRGSLSGPTYRRTFYPNVIEEAQAKIIELRDGQEATGVDIAMGQPIKTYNASGRIVSVETGQPLPNVSFGYGTLREGSSTMNSFLPGTRANERGEFRLEGLLSGRYAVFLSNVAAVVPSGDVGNFYSEQVPFEITDGDISGIEIKAQRSSSITGVLAAEDGNDAAIFSQMGRSFVSAYPVERGTYGMPMSSEGVVKPDGSFSITGLPPGKMRISFGGSQSLRLARIERDSTTINDAMIELAPGEQVSGLRIIVSSGTGVIRGEVKITGVPLPPGVRLVAIVTRPNTPMGGSPPAEIDARGRFVIEKLAPGDYEIRFTFAIATTAPTSGQLPRIPTTKQTVTVTNGAETQVTLTVELIPRDKEP